MARDRIIPAELWTREAVIDCAAMTRLLFIVLWNFADDSGVQPLRPHTFRMQVFAGDPIDNDAARAMVDELAANGLARLYEVDSMAYVEIVGWHQLRGSAGPRGGGSHRLCPWRRRSAKRASGRRRPLQTIAMSGFHDLRSPARQVNNRLAPSQTIAMANPRLMPSRKRRFCT